MNNVYRLNEASIQLSEQLSADVKQVDLIKDSLLLIEQLIDQVKTSTDISISDVVYESTSTLINALDNSDNPTLKYRLGNIVESCKSTHLYNISETSGTAIRKNLPPELSNNILAKFGATLIDAATWGLAKLYDALIELCKYINLKIKETWFGKMGDKESLTRLHMRELREKDPKSAKNLFHIIQSTRAMGMDLLIKNKASRADIDKIKAEFDMYDELMVDTRKPENRRENV